MKKPPTTERQALQKLLNITKLIRERHWEAYSPSERNRLNNAVNLCHIIITAKPPSDSLPVDFNLE